MSIFVDTGQRIEAFFENIYVHCPKCNKRAQVIRVPVDGGLTPPEETGLEGTNYYQFVFQPRKLSCLHCGYTSVHDGQSLCMGGPHDVYFRLPLWLQTPCCNETLWAFNEQHLEFLEQYVTARQRIKFRSQDQFSNKTLAGRLPLWMKSAKNREKVLKGIARLKDILRQSQVD